MNKTLLSISAAALMAAATGSALAIEQRPFLTLEVAKKMAEACEARARQEGWKMNIAILDSGGNLKHFSRMDDSFLKSIDIALIKAETSAGFPFSTKTVGEIAATRVPGIAHIPGIATFEGGLPIMTADGKHVGSIGVSGATAEQDGICAQAALDAVKNELK
jgi:glc operon protein GlcG